MALTPDPGQRASRALTAAEAKYAAGDFEAAQALLVTAEAGPPGELGEARAQRMRAQVAFALRRGGDAPPLMLRAAQRLQSLDADLARQTYLEALVAAIYAGRLAQGQDARQVARAARSAALRPSGPEPLPHSQLLIGGLAVRLADGYVAAAPALKEALRRYRRSRWSWTGCPSRTIAMDMWRERGSSGRPLRLARANGTLTGFLAWLSRRVRPGRRASAAALLMERGASPGQTPSSLSRSSSPLARDRDGGARPAGVPPPPRTGQGRHYYTDYARCTNKGQGHFRAAAHGAPAPGSTRRHLAVGPV